MTPANIQGRNRYQPIPFAGSPSAPSKPILVPRANLTRPIPESALTFRTTAHPHLPHLFRFHHSTWVVMWDPIFLPSPALRVCQKAISHQSLALDAPKGSIVRTCQVTDRILARRLLIILIVVCYMLACSPDDLPPVELVSSGLSAVAPTPTEDWHLPD